MNGPTPSPVFLRMTEASPKTASDRTYLSNEHRPFICYGVSWVSGYVLARSPAGIIIPAGLTGVFVTLVEWASMVQRFDRIPLAALDPGLSNKFGNPLLFPQRPYFPTAPFVIDLAASFVRQAPRVALLPIVDLEFLLVPADAANLAAAGLQMPRKK